MALPGKARLPRLTSAPVRALPWVVGLALVLLIPSLALAAAPTISKVSPALGMTTFPVDLVVTGTGFVSGNTVRLGNTPLDGVTFVSSSSLKATVPAGFQAGLYDLAVETPPPGGQVVYLSKAYMAVSPTPALSTGLRNPNKLAADTAQNLFVADPQGGRVVGFDAKGQPRLTIPNVDPLGIAVDREGQILVGDRRLKAIRVYSRLGLPVKTFGQGRLEAPVDVAVDYTSGWVYVLDQVRNAIAIFDGQGNFLSADTTWKDQAGNPVQFNAPTAISVDRVRNELLVADQNNKLVLIFSIPAGSAPTAFTLAAPPIRYRSPVRFTRIQGLTVDADGRIYVSDAYQNLVQVVDRTGSLVGFMGGFGNGSGDVSVPAAILVDPYKRIVVADWNNGRVNFYASGALPANSQGPTLTGIQPLQGATGFPASVTITGTGFMVGATVKLVAEGANEIPGSNVQVVDAEYLTATFDLTGAAPGTWSLSLTNPDGQTATLSRSFVVLTPDFHLAAAPVAQMVIPGGGTSFVVTVSPLGGFTGTVDLTLVGAPIAATVSPVRIRPGEMAVVSVPTPPDYGYGGHLLTVKGTAGGLVHEALVTLNVVKPAALRVFTKPGGSRVYLDGNYGYLGRFVGMTPESGDHPLVIPSLLPGPHILRVTHPGNRGEYSRRVLVSGVNEARVQLPKGEPPPDAWTPPVAVADGSINPLAVPGPSTVFVLDWLNRGRKDLVVGDGEGDVHVFLDVGTGALPEFSTGPTGHVVLTDMTGKSLKGDRGGAIFAVDWNNDGRQDLLVADSSGTIRLYLNHGTSEVPLYAQPRLLQAGLEGALPRDIRLSSRFVAPVVADWDQDGRKDLVLGDEDGRLWLFRNHGTDAEPELGLAEEILLPPGNIGQRASPFFVYWDKDDRADLLVGRQDGSVISYKRQGGPNKPTFAKSSEPLLDSGGVPLGFGGDAAPFIVDWAGDGRRDILSGMYRGEILWSQPSQRQCLESTRAGRRDEESCEMAERGRTPWEED